jgi:Fe-S-cluster containining protein
MTIERIPLLPMHPAAAQPSTDSPPCHLCTALCCRYFALELDTPEDAADFDALRWYLLHGTSWLWVEDGDWYLQVDQPCRYLGNGNECTIYDKRPEICRDYGLPEKREHPDDPLCDYFAQAEHHDLEFRDIPEFDAYVEKFLAEREATRQKRSHAAKRAWKEKRAGAVPTVAGHAPTKEKRR